MAKALYSEVVRILFNRIHPTINYAERLLNEPGYRWGPRTIPDYQLLFVLSGQLQLSIGNEDYKLRPNSCAFYGPDCPHRLHISSEEPCVLYSLHFEWERGLPTPVHPAPNIRENEEAEWRQPPREYQIAIDEHGGIRLPNAFYAPGLEPYFRNVIDEYSNQEPCYEMAMRAQMTALLAELVRLQLLESPDPGRCKIAPALEAIKLNPERNWTSRELAQKCGYNPTYFAELFKETIGFGPKTYMVRERIRRAKKLLLTHARITDIAESLGYENVHYFSRNFKENTGLTPSEYRMKKD